MARAPDDGATLAPSRARRTSGTPAGRFRGCRRKPSPACQPRSQQHQPVVTHRHAHRALPLAVVHAVAFDDVGMHFAVRRGWGSSQPARGHSTARARYWLMWRNRSVPPLAIFRPTCVKDARPVRRIDVHLRPRHVGRQRDATFQMRSQRVHRLQRLAGQAVGLLGQSGQVDPPSELRPGKAPCRSGYVMRSAVRRSSLACSRKSSTTISDVGIAKAQRFAQRCGKFVMAVHDSSTSVDASALWTLW